MPRSLAVPPALLPGHHSALDVSATDPQRQRIHAWYREHRGAIARALLAATGDPAAVDDLVNETFVRAFQALSSFDERSTPSTWLHGIALNVARNHAAKHRRRAALDATRPPRLAEATATPDEALAGAEALARLHARLAALDPMLREAFVLRVLEQRPLKEVAEILRVPLSTAHARATRAEALVRAAFDAEEAP